MDLWLLDVWYIGPKWSGPSRDPAQAGARCTGLPFLNLVEDFDKNWVDENLVQFRLETFCGVLYKIVLYTICMKWIEKLLGTIVMFQ
jgi:hypothetical protein